MARTEWIPWGELLAEHLGPLRLWLGPLASQRYLAALESEFGPEAVIQQAPDDAVADGPAVLLLRLGDVQGPHGQALLELCQRALPGRPVICGGSRHRDALLGAINTWRAFRVLPGSSSASMVVAALRQAHEALSLELMVDRTIADLRRRCHELQLATDRLRQAEDQLVRAERQATVEKISRTLSPLLGAQAHKLDALERSLESMDDPTLGGLLREAISRARSIRTLVEEMLSLSSAGEQEQEEDLDAMVERAFHLMRHEPEMRRRTLQVCCTSGARVRMDHRGMSLALMHLMRGAVEDSDAFSLIRVHTSQQDNQAVIEINSGGTDRRQDGSDLGLPVRLGKLTVECQGGSLRCHDTPGAGIRYRVLLPLAK